MYMVDIYDERDEINKIHKFCIYTYIIIVSIVIIIYLQ